MKVNIDYEFKCKIQNEIDIDDLRPYLGYDAFAKEFNDVIDDGVKQLLADELADHNKELVTVERIGLSIRKVD